ncbi:MAG TPA: hypothetical protein VMV78_06345 [Thiobacillus sp.]|nr:hypothetical protein [Thiobacillus sp.]
MRAKTAKLNPAPIALHLIASGVVDQIRMTETNAAGSDIPVLQNNKLPPFSPLQTGRTAQTKRPQIISVAFGELLEQIMLER